MGSRRLVAVTREVSAGLAGCELTYVDRQPIDVALARRQHAAYEDALRQCGCDVHRLPEAPGLPDSVFVEDTAVVVDELAILTRPGAASRRAEVPAVEHALSRWRPIARIEPPATLDGGDVLRVGRSVWVGRSSRTNRAGLDQLAALLEPLGYDVEGVAVRGCLHLKSAVTAAADGLVLLNPAWVDRRVFGNLDVVCVDPDEPHAANALPIGAHTIYPGSCPRTAARLRARGVDLVEVDLTELAKAEGAVTCCSLIVD